MANCLEFSRYASEAQQYSSSYKHTPHPPNLPPEIERAIALGSYTKRMSLMADRAIMAAELRYELEFGGVYHG